MEVSNLHWSKGPPKSSGPLCIAYSCYMELRHCPAGKGVVVGLLSWHMARTYEFITFCKVRHGDSVTKPDYYYLLLN